MFCILQMKYVKKKLQLSFPTCIQLSDSSNWEKGWPVEEFQKVERMRMGLNVKENYIIEK